MWCCLGHVATWARNLDTVNHERLYEIYCRTALPMYKFGLPHELVQKYGPITVKIYKDNADLVQQNDPNQPYLPDNFENRMINAFKRAEFIYNHYNDEQLEYCIGDYEYFNYTQGSPQVRFTKF